MWLGNCQFVYRRKSFAMLILHTSLVLYKYKHVEANRRKSFAIATAIAKFAKLFPRVTFPAYGNHNHHIAFCSKSDDETLL